MSPSADSTNTLSDDQILREIINSSQGANQELPNLTPELSAMKWLKEIWNSAKEWINDRLNIGHLLSLPEISFGSLYDIFLYALYVVITVFLSYIAFYILKRAVGRRVLDTESIKPVSSDLLIEHSLSEALAKKEFPLAFRLRWKLHLFRAKHALSSTPFELYQNSSIGLIYPQLLYMRMFGEDPTSEPLYKEYDEALLSIEVGA